MELRTKIDDENEIKIVKEDVAGGAITILTGAAKKIYDPVAVELEGVIGAPAEFAQKRKDTINPLTAHVVANYSNRTITLHVNEGDKFSATIKGSLTIYPELLAFGINKNNTVYNNRELYNLLKMRGLFFKTKEDFRVLIESLKKFDASVKAQFLNANDYKGNKALNAVLEIKSNVALNFTLSIPVFSGLDKRDIKVEINVELKDNEVVFWLESLDLYEIMLKESETQIDDQLKSLSEYVIIKQF